MNNKWLNRLFPVLAGFFVIIILVSLMIGLNISEGKFQISLIFFLGLGGLISGKISGPEGIYGAIIFTLIIIGCYLIFQFFSPDALWIIGLFFILFVLGFYWAGWVVGNIFFKKDMMNKKAKCLLG